MLGQDDDRPPERAARPDGLARIMQQGRGQHVRSIEPAAPEITHYAQPMPLQIARQRSKPGLRAGRQITIGLT